MNRALTSVLVTAVAAASATASTATPQLGKFVPADPDIHAHFGNDVSTDGQRAVFGSFLDDDKGQYSGSAYVFEHALAGWVQSAKLTASDGAPSDNFGQSVSVHGDIVAVGAPNDQDFGFVSGAVYVFELVGPNWVETAKLTSPAQGGADAMGFDVAVSNGIVFAGAPGAGAQSQGQVYAYEKIGGVWTLKATLGHSGATVADRFGISVDVDGDLVAIGAQTEPPRVCRRLQTLRGWSHDEKKQVLPRGPRAGRADGLRAPAGARLGVGSDRFDC